MSETQRNVWLLSMPARAEVTEAMQCLTGVRFETSEQHKDMGSTRQTRDVDDTLTLLDYLRNRSPFSHEPSLRSIASGLTAESSVNVEHSKNIGQKILNSMVGKQVEDFTFKKCNQSVTLGTITQVKIQNETFHVDPQLMFQRLATIGRKRADGDPSEIFRYELCSFPPALFESSCLPLQANKPALADALWKEVKQEETVPSSNVQYILDGGALLYRLPWSRTTTYSEVCQMYVDYASKRYGNAKIVFDGYSDQPSTKDTTHLRQCEGARELTAQFNEDMVIKSRKEKFLSNEVNKQGFINLLSEKLEKAGCTTVHAEGDADVLIVTRAVEYAQTTDTILVGDDTDLLVLLIYLAKTSGKNIYLAPEPKASAKGGEYGTSRNYGIAWGQRCALASCLFTLVWDVTRL